MKIHVGARDADRQALHQDLQFESEFHANVKGAAALLGLRSFTEDWDLDVAKVSRGLRVTKVMKTAQIA